MRLVIVGAGAMGATFGGVLAEHGVDVCLVDSWREHIDAINKNGLRIVGAGGDRTVSIRATSKISDAGPADVILLFVKSLQTEQAARDALSIASERTTFLTLQNGYGNHEIIDNTVGKGRVILGTTFHSAVLLGPGHVKHANAAATTIGEPDHKRTTRVEEVAKLLTDGGIPVEVTDRILDDVWSKLYINAVFNATCGVTGYRSGDVVAFDPARVWMTKLAKETLAVIAAMGVRLPYDDPIEKIWQVSRGAGDAKPSMLQDIEARRLTEVDFINGAVVKAARRERLPAPLNETLVDFVHMIEARYQETKTVA